MEKEKNKKWLALLLIIFLVLVIVLQVLVYFKKKEAEKNIPTKQENSARPTFPIVQKENEQAKNNAERDKIVFEGDTFQMPTKEGSFLKLKNPFKKENSVYVMDEFSALIEESVDFNIEFQNFPDGEGPFYFIVLKNKDIQKARDAGEQALLKYLEITPEQACQIQVSIGIPASVNDKLGGKNFGLSFCPDGEPFPSDWKE